MKRARWLVIVDAILAGLLSLMGFLFGLFAVSVAETTLVGVLGWFQVALAVVMMFASHFTMRAAFRRGVVLTPRDVGRSKGLRLVPLLTTGALAAQLVIVQSLGAVGPGAFAWDLTNTIFLPLFFVSLLWHVLTLVLLHRPHQTVGAVGR